MARDQEVAARARAARERVFSLKMAHEGQREERTSTRGVGLRGWGVLFLCVWVRAVARNGCVPSPLLNGARTASRHPFKHREHQGYGNGCLVRVGGNQVGWAWRVGRWNDHERERYDVCAVCAVCLHSHACGLAVDVESRSVLLPGCLGLGFHLEWCSSGRRHLGCGRHDWWW